MICYNCLIIIVGVTVLFEVDATSLASHAELKERTFHKVMFNFPHVGGKSDIRRNRRLLREFFLRYLSSWFSSPIPCCPVRPNVTFDNFTYQMRHQNSLY